MYKFDGFAFLDIVRRVELFRKSALHLWAAGVQEPDARHVGQMQAELEDVLARCKKEGFDFVADHLDRMLQTFKGKFGGYDNERIQVDMRELNLRLGDVMQRTLLMRIPPDRLDYYDKPALFGQHATDRFSDATYDISEAGSCYATDRYTACVMHLMRALEVALKAVGHGVGLPNAVELARNNWTAALKGIGDQIGVNDKAADPAWTPEKSSFLKDVRAQLFAVKVAWRDNAMHLEKKYDEKDAKRIYDAVKSFMEHLAEHLDQSGQFTP